jgi:hypothetical protein
VLTLADNGTNMYAIDGAAVYNQSEQRKSHLVATCGSLDPEALGDAYGAAFMNESFGTTGTLYLGDDADRLRSLPPEFKARLSPRLKRDYSVNLERPPQGGFSVL